ncbi:hypothetical protein [Paraburkholderia sediminicola]|uniref:hypothetical protein n=1 Tax=Paraburkholderia sediminicola TaxID=458836 RepID=UPI0038B74C16
MAKPNKPEGIPIRSLVNDDRNYDRLVGEIIHMQTRYRELVQDNDRNGLNRYSKGLLVSECETQIRAREALQQAISIRDAIKQERKILQVMGEGLSGKNQEKARRPRPKKNEAGDTLDEIIRNLARTHRDEHPGEVWPHLKTAIEDWSDSSDVREIGDGDSRSYRYKQSDKLGGITYAWFRKKFRRYKTGI